MGPKFISKYLLILVSIVWYMLLYYYIDRSEFLFLISGVAILGVIYFYWLKNSCFNVKEIVVIAIIFRLVLLFGTPNFSDDYYRFVWDGKMTNEIGNPYEFTPQEIINSNKDFRVGEKVELAKKLNSFTYYTVYPPLNQMLFSAASYLGGGNIGFIVFWLKLFIFVVDIGLIYLLILFLRKLNLKQSLAQIYALNPLVIIELTGNIHFEGVMLFFFAFALYFIYNNRILFGSIALGMAISVKLIPLLFLPLFLPFLGFARSTKLYLGVAVTFCFLLLPFLSQTLISNFSQSLELYFQTFEFNASFYYVLKSISYFFLGYKSSVIGTIIPIFILLFSIVLTAVLYRKKLKKFDLVLFSKFAGFLLFVFYLFASTVHPWYLVNVVFLSVFLAYRTFLVWSIVSFISYFAYSSFVSQYAAYQDFHQFNWYYILIGIEYVIVLFLFTFETINVKKNSLKK